MTHNRYGAAFGLGVGLCMALAANITAAWPQGPVMIVAGVAAPIVLPLVLWIRSGLTPNTQRYSLQWWSFVAVREASITAVAGPAAAMSYWHTYTLMTSHGVPWSIAVVLPLSADGVATISTLALHHHRREPETVPEVEAVPEVEVASEPAPVQPVKRTVADEVRRRNKVVDRVAWVRDQGFETWSEQVAAVEKHFQVSKSTAKRVVAEATS